MNTFPKQTPSSQRKRKSHKNNRNQNQRKP